MCSLYILDQRAQRLTLWATTGLERSAVGKVTMSVEEGLTGMAIEKLEPVMAVDAIAHPRYKFFPETGEEKYHSFLGVPIIERSMPIGVLVVQTLRRRRFARHEIRLLRAIGTQVGSIIAQARLAEDLKTKEKERREYRRRMITAIKRLQAYEKEDQPEPKTRGKVRGRLSGLPAAPGYGVTDLFFPAQGRFSLLKTCNVWVGQGLKASGLPTGLWTPFSFQVLSHL